MFQLSLLGKRGFYLKNTDVIEQLTYRDTIGFDKTGTLTEAGVVNGRKSDGVIERKDAAGAVALMEVGHRAIVEAFSPGLTDMERAMIGTLVSQSAHPLSRHLARHSPISCQCRSKTLRNCPVRGLGVL